MKKHKHPKKPTLTIDSLGMALTITELTTKLQGGLIHKCLYHTKETKENFFEVIYQTMKEVLMDWDKTVK